MNDHQKDNSPPEYAADHAKEKTEESLREHYQKDAGPIRWKDLERLFAQGVLIEVDSSLNLLDVAVAMGLNDSQKIKNWIDKKLYQRVPDETALDWVKRDPILVAIVVSPWVIVQEPPKDKPEDQPG